MVLLFLMFTHPPSDPAPHEADNIIIQVDNADACPWIGRSSLSVVGWALCYDVYHHQGGVFSIQLSDMSDA